MTLSRRSLTKVSRIEDDMVARMDFSAKNPSGNAVLYRPLQSSAHRTSTEARIISFFNDF